MELKSMIVPYAGVNLFCMGDSLFDQTYEISNIFQAFQLSDVESYTEFHFCAHDDVDVIERIPTRDLIGGGLFSEGQMVIADYLTDDFT
jgi:hypothetical protein